MYFIIFNKSYFLHERFYLTSIYISYHLLIHLYIFHYLLIHLYILLCTYPSTYLTIYLSIYTYCNYINIISDYLSTYLYLSINQLYLFIFLYFLFLYNHLSTYLYLYFYHSKERKKCAVFFVTQQMSISSVIYNSNN